MYSFASFLVNPCFRRNRIVCLLSLRSCYLLIVFIDFSLARFSFPSNAFFFFSASASYSSGDLPLVTTFSRPPGVAWTVITSSSDDASGSTMIEQTNPDGFSFRGLPYTLDYSVSSESSPTICNSFSDSSDSEETSSGGRVLRNYACWNIS